MPDRFEVIGQSAERGRKTPLLWSRTRAPTDIARPVGGDDVEIVEVRGQRGTAHSAGRETIRRYRPRLARGPSGGGSTASSACKRKSLPHVPPVIVSGTRELPISSSLQRLRRLAQLSARPVRAIARRSLLEETVLLLHRSRTRFPNEQRETLARSARDRSDADRQEGAGRRRRPAQHLRADQRSGAPRTSTYSTPRTDAPVSSSSEDIPTWISS